MPTGKRKELRKGYTTGACAAAAAKAATLALLGQQPVATVEIDLPVGRSASFSVAGCEVGPEQATCTVIKDAGDDPDVTHGAEVCATVSYAAGLGLAIAGGEGVGVVTRPGLELAVGEPAINPVPRQMIAQSVAQAAGPNGPGLRVVISVPRGEKLARRTLNPRLGIVGGISILGTTGIVVPYSTAAYKACITQALDVAVAGGLREVVLTTGGRSERFAQRLMSLPEPAFVQMGDFASFALRECGRKGLDKVTICGMVGKLSKMAAGHGQTHVSRSRVEIALLARLAAAQGASPAVLAELQDANTARHFADIARQHGLEGVFPEICRLAAMQAQAWAEGKLAVGVIMTDFEGHVLGRAELEG